jgi:glycosyltransferase involved in cell wall biosynthesis
MINGKRVAVVMPAYNAEKTLGQTVREMPEAVDFKILVDDGSTDRTVPMAESLGLKVFAHDRNYGYGRNQQTCYREALAAGADVVVMVHPDYQYTPLLVTAMAGMVASGVYDVVLFTGAKLSEYHTGFRAFTSDVLRALPLLENSDDFVFDNEVLAQCIYFGFRLGEISCPTKYFEEASSVNFGRSVKYGFGVLATTLKLWLQRLGLVHLRLFSPTGRKLDLGYYRERKDAPAS